MADSLSTPLSTLSPSKQNARLTPAKSTPQSDKTFNPYIYQNINPITGFNMAESPIPSSPAPADYHTTTDFPKNARPSSSHSNPPLSPVKPRSPVKYRLQDHAIAANSPPGSPAESTLRFNEGLTRAVGITPQTTSYHNTTDTVRQNGIVNGFQRDDTLSVNKLEAGDVSDIDITLGLNETMGEDTVGDLSTISAIPTDMTRFANLRTSPPRTIEPDRASPSKRNRQSVIFGTPATGQRPLQLLSRRSTSSNEDEEQTPRRKRDSDDSPTDLLNFTGQTDIHIPPPSSARPTNRRTPSGRGAFPIRVNPSPVHRSQASVDRERATGRSPQKSTPDNTIPATPASARHSAFATSTAGLGMDLLDIDLQPMATPRSIPTITPRELETLRSELQSRISGLEATLSGKEAEVVALKRAITDAEVRSGKASEELHNERLEKEELLSQKQEFERRAREMEDVLREVKQNAFVEEREREKLRRQAEEADRRSEEMEVRILELTASLETLRSERVMKSPSPQKSANEPATPGQALDIDAAVKNATETVARELHALYKNKHERKVGDLKLSYEKRWVKQVEALKQELKQSQEEVSRLLTERDLTMSGVVPGHNEAISRMEGQVEELRRWNEETSAQKKVVEAEVAGLKSELQTVRIENDKLRVEVESERVEKGELVAQVEVFLAVSAEQEKTREREREAQEARDREKQPVSPPRSDASGETTTNASAQVASPNKNRMSAPVNGVGGRPRPMSMLVKPGQTKFGSGIPGPGSSGLKAPSAGLGNRASVYGRGSLMDGIARMGANGR